MTTSPLATSTPRKGRFPLPALLRWAASGIILAGLLAIILSEILGPALFPRLWGVEPLAYIGALFLVAGLSLLCLLQPALSRRNKRQAEAETRRRTARYWTDTTHQYFDRFNHDLGRPLRRILGKERDLRGRIASGQVAADLEVRQLLDEIETQTPAFRLILDNLHALIDLETPGRLPEPQAVEPDQLVLRIVDRYQAAAREQGKTLEWHAAPGLIKANGPALEHILVNLVDNALRHARSAVEVYLTREESALKMTVWDDGPGIPERYRPYIWDRGWTPEKARGEERATSGLGLHIARTLAEGYGGSLILEEPGPSPAAGGSNGCAPTERNTMFTLTLPVNDPPAPPPPDPNPAADDNPASGKETPK